MAEKTEKTNETNLGKITFNQTSSKNGKPRFYVEIQGIKVYCDSTNYSKIMNGSNAILVERTGVESGKKSYSIKAEKTISAKKEIDFSKL